MKKISLELLYTAGEHATIILPDKLSHLEILGIAEQLLVQPGLPSAKIIISGEQAIAQPFEHSSVRTNCL